MRTRTECTLQLLNELDLVCKDKKIQYCTGGIVARAVFEKRSLVFPCLDIYVLEEDVSVLHSHLIAVMPDDRTVEKNADDNCFHYVDTTTTFIDSYMMSPYKEKGIHLNIVPVCKNGLNDYETITSFREKAKISNDLFFDTSTYDYNDTSFEMPSNLTEWYDFLFYDSNINERVFPGYPDNRCIVSTTVSYKELINCCLDFDADSLEMNDNKILVDIITDRIDDRMLLINGVMDKIGNKLKL